MLLAGGQGSRLYALTRNVAKPNVPFGGKYRIIDFPLSNCANSGIDTVGVLTQYKPLMLNSYIGNGQPWDLDHSDGGVYILPPYMVEGEKGNWFAGTANAIYQNIQFMDTYNPENVLILSGDHIYKMDYADMLREHLEKDAALTIAVQQVSMEEATRLGIMSCGEDGYINDFEEKPAHPKSDLASMGIYIFNYEKLKKYLVEDEADPNSSKDFGKNIIPNMLKAGEKMWAYRFNGYWRDVGTITSLWDANMDMLSPDLINLFDAEWPVRSRTDGVRGVANTELSCELAVKIGRATAAVLTDNEHRKPKVLIGQDTRASSSMLESAISAGLCSVGADVMTLGVVPTPAVAYLVKKYGYDAAVMISASHNPCEYNGIKIFRADGYKLPDRIEDEIERIILDEIEKPELKIGGEVGTVSVCENTVNDYIEHLRNSVEVSVL